MKKENETTNKTENEQFEELLHSYNSTIVDLFKSEQQACLFLSKVRSAIKKTPGLLKCTSESLIGSVLYFAEVQLPFDTPEGYGYISIEKNADERNAVPIIGYKGLIEIAHRNPKIQQIRIQSVYENDSFDYEYGTNEYLTHKPCNTGVKGKLKCVYAMCHIKEAKPLFVVIHKEDLDKIQKLSKTGSGKNSFYNNEADVFNLMQAKAAIKLLFKTLPKEDNAQLMKALEMDNIFDYEKNVKINAIQNGYEMVKTKQRTSAMQHTQIEPLQITVTEDLKAKKQEKS